MRPSGWLLLTRLSLCVALLSSAVLYVHYLNPADSEFCGPRSGCETVRHSDLSYFGSPYVSLPLFGLIGFLIAFAATLRCDAARPGPPGASGEGRARSGAVPEPSSGGLRALWARPELTTFLVCGLGAVVAVGLIAYQLLYIGEACWLCLIVDGASVAAGAASFAFARALRGTSELPRAALRHGAWAAIAAVLIGAPLLWNVIRPAPDIPAPIAALYQPGKINVVEFADFECPYCRRLHAMLGPLLAEYGSAVNFVRVHRPLPQHPNAERAARAAICADAQGRGEPMAERLFSISLSPEAIGRAAEAVGLDPGAFDACMSSPETTATLERHAALLPDERLRGLPTTYVGQKVIVGVGSPAMFRDALERARTPEVEGPPGSVYILLIAIATALIAWFGRVRTPAPAV